MCGRFAFDAGRDALVARFGTKSAPDAVTPHYNVAPGMMMPIVLRSSPNRAVLARWGLVPSWSKDPKIAWRTVNARAEGIQEKPVFRGPFKSRRCLVPATGFFEWKRAGDEKIPYYIRLSRTPLFAFAGLYDVWLDAENHPLTTFTVITTAPNKLMAPIHTRMPVILSRAEEDLWLDPDTRDFDALLSLLDPYPAREMEAYPVSRLVNSPANDTKEVLARFDADRQDRRV
jgi:putative SOS response-associated peptidase YedK